MLLAARGKDASHRSKLRQEALIHRDIVFAQASDMWWKVNLTSKWERGGSILRYAFDWALRNTDAEYIVKSDVDGYVCPYHLQYVLQTLAQRRLFYARFTHDASFTSHARFTAAECWADQNFQSYSRELLQDALLSFNSTGAWLATYNWARNFGWFLQRAWLRGDTTVFHDSSAIIASKGNGSSAMKAIQNFPSQSEKTLEKDVFDNFCKKFVFGHIRSKDTKPFYELYRRGKKNRCVKDAPDDPRQCYNLGAYLEGTRTPPCYKLLHADIKLNDSG